MSPWWPSPCGPGARGTPSRRRARRPSVVTTTGATSSTKTPAATGTSTGTATAARGPKPAPVALLIGALDATTAWRASTGTCDRGGSALSVTADGGETWDKTKAPARSVIRVQPLDEDRVFAVAAGADCELKQYASNDRGDSWQAPTAVSGGWARQLDEPTEVLTPQDDRAQPCGAVDRRRRPLAHVGEPGAGPVRRRRRDGDQRRRRRPGPTPARWRAASPSATVSRRVSSRPTSRGSAATARASSSCGSPRAQRSRASRASARACRRRPARSACRSSTRRAGWWRATRSGPPAPPSRRGSSA